MFYIRNVRRNTVDERDGGIIMIIAAYPGQRGLVRRSGQSRAASATATEIGGFNVFACASRGNGGGGGITFVVRAIKY